jgi:Ca2+-binding EF-hand superfamily protein
MNRYLTEFEGRFAEVLDVSEVFRKIAASDKADTNAAELNEVEFLRFLTTQNRTMTRDQMRKTFASVDFDKSGGISFIEWLVFRYEKTVADLMAPQDPLPAELRAELNQTLEEYQQVRENAVDFDTLSQFLFPRRWLRSASSPTRLPSWRLRLRRAA